MGRALQQLGSGDGRSDRSAHRRGASDPRPLVRIRRSSKARSRPTRSSARSWRRRCPARRTCSSITSWAKPTASAACGVTSAAAWAASRRRSPRRPRDLGVEIRTEAEVAQDPDAKTARVTGVALAQRRRVLRPRTSPRGVDCHITFQKLLDPAELPPEFQRCGRAHFVQQRVVQNQRRAGASAELHRAARARCRTAAPRHRASLSRSGLHRARLRRRKVRQNVARAGRRVHDAVVARSDGRAARQTPHVDVHAIRAIRTDDGPWTDAMRNEYADRCFDIVEQYAPGFKTR